jgi:tetratricopeptide (TPR) repeat protein
MQNCLFLLPAALLSTALMAQEPAEKKETPPAPSPAPVEKKEEPKEPAKGPSSDDLKAGQDRAAAEFRAMPLEYRQLVVEAMKRFQSRDFTGALNFVDRAEKLQVPTVWTLNVRGAVAIEQRQFEEGERYCNAALKLDPTFFPAKFNLCEIPFLQGRYADARKAWEKLLDEYPVNIARSKEDGTPELLAYRIFLCYLLEKDKKSAREWLDKIPFPSTTPAYHFGHAAWERDQGRMEKWQEWIEQAEFIWPESKRASFTDVLIQLGWLKPPFGEKPPENK